MQFQKGSSRKLGFRHILFSETHGFGGMKKGRSYYAPAQWSLYALGSLAVPLRLLPQNAGWANKPPNLDEHAALLLREDIKVRPWATHNQRSEFFHGVHPPHEGFG
jgi:hypothetical protein